MSEDTISRQAAIDAVRRSEALDRAFGYGHAVDALRELPSAQADSKETSSTHKALDTISRQAVYNVLDKMPVRGFKKEGETIHGLISLSQVNSAIINLPSAQPTIYGYNVEHLEMIARVLQKENLPPERVVEMLTDIGRIVAIVCDEFEDNLRKAVEQCMT